MKNFFRHYALLRGFFGGGDSGSGGAGGGTRADWNQNNPTAADYVKNRPFYTGDPVETLLIEETTNNWVGEPLVLAPIDIVEGQRYTVMFDGVKYECIAYIAAGPNSPSLGDGAIVEVGNDGSNGEPFFITVFEGVTLVMAGEMGEHTVSVRTCVGEIYKLDGKYMPENFVPAPTESSLCAYLFPIGNLAYFFHNSNDAYEFFRTPAYEGMGDKTLPATPEQWESVWGVFRAASMGKLVVLVFDGNATPHLVDAYANLPNECNYMSSTLSTVFLYDEETGLITKTW